MGPAPATLPYGALNPTVPVKDAGPRVEPPMSDAVASVVIPAASAAPAPPEEPPGEYSVFHGLRVTPQTFEWVKPAIENSGVAVRAWTIAPASSSRSMIGAFSVATTPSHAAEASMTLCPASMCFSFAATVTPSSGRAVPSR